MDHVVDRAGRGRKVKDVSNWTTIKLAANVAFEEFEARLIRKMFNVLAPSGQQIIERNYLVSFAEQGITKMRAKKSGSSCY